MTSVLLPCEQPTTHQDHYLRHRMSWIAGRFLGRSSGVLASALAPGVCPEKPRAKMTHTISSAQPDESARNGYLNGLN